MKTKQTVWSGRLLCLLISIALPAGPAVAQPPYTVLHHFAGGAGDGAIPYDSLTLSGSTLYGMTMEGGAAGQGTIFQIDTDGTGFSVLREFAGGADDGAFPYGSLTLSGSTLSGMTSLGGEADLGTIFQIDTDGAGFSLLHSFAGGAGDGANPHGSLTSDGDMLYGMTTRGGAANVGTIFVIPEPGTSALVALGIGGLLAARRRRRGGHCKL